MPSVSASVSASASRNIHGATARRNRPRSAWMRAGYTLIEVMMGLSVLAIGASAVLSIQQVAVFGGINQRNIIGATNASQTWLDRIRVEAMSWRSPTNADITALNTPFLNAGTSGPTSFRWTSPSTVVGASGAHALDGGEIVPSLSAPAVAYCTHYRITNIEPTANPATFRLEVRTLFAKNGRTIDAECSAGPGGITTMLTAGGTLAVDHGSGTVTHGRDEYGVIVLTTVLRRQP